MAEWFEDESLWIDLYPFTFSDERPGLGEAEVSKILALVGLTAPEGKAALDPCVARVPAGRIARPEEIAGVHAFLASEDAAFITGQVLFVDGGMSVGA